MRPILTAPIFFMAAFSALFLAHPQSAEYAVAEFGHALIFGSYLLLAILTTVIVIVGRSGLGQAIAATNQKIQQRYVSSLVLSCLWRSPRWPLLLVWV
jgi:hypothetical protein